ncbi:metallophosphoesterase [Salibacterium salarium]|uniref:metallophosphoesterase n=1 Tax=Salibacterium salarium TaxID=284579 RepID=UPI001FEA602E|nr:metallophosphoesterase [Salibacterium salarium]
MTKKRWMLLILITAAAAIVGKSYYDTNVFKTAHVTFASEELPSDTSIRMLQISDLHNKQFGESNEPLLHAAKEADPDMIVVTGDLIDESTSSMEPMLQLMKKLTNVTEKIYFVTGNHEWDNPHTETLLNGLEERDITVLGNTHTQVEIDGAVINLAGIDDHYTNHHNLIRAFQGINEEHYTILLSHAPLIVENETAARADLILSGHTHGGQIRLPFLGGLVSPGKAFSRATTKERTDLSPAAGSTSTAASAPV